MQGRSSLRSEVNPLAWGPEVNIDTTRGEQHGIVTTGKPTFAFIAASWTALLLGGLAFLIGLWRSSMLLSEKGFYFTLFMYGLFAAVSVQKSVRDRLEGVPVTAITTALAGCRCSSRSH